MIAPPIPLAAPDGRVYAYACPRCHQVRIGGEFLVQLTGPDAGLVERMRLDADQCCRCERCGVALSERSRGPCETCKPAADAEQAEREAIWAERAAADEAARERSLERATDRSAALRLREVMSDTSEEYWCAGWLMGLEFSLWEMLLGGDRAFGFGEVGRDEIAELRRLREASGGWWRWDKTHVALFVPTEEWVEMYDGWSGASSLARAEAELEKAQRAMRAAEESER